MTDARAIMTPTMIGLAIAALCLAGLGVMVWVATREED
jgi:hypothetical protein